MCRPLKPDSKIARTELRGTRLFIETEIECNSSLMNKSFQLFD